MRWFVKVAAAASVLVLAACSSGGKTKTAGDAENYSAQQWNYLWCSEYGSREYSAATPDFDARVREYNRLRLERDSRGWSLAARYLGGLPGLETRT